jgi:hypothetical protein
LPPNRSIGLWSDAVSGVTELALDDRAHALCFTVRSRYEREYTLEGRSDDDQALVWTLDLSNADDRPKSVTAAKVPAWLQTGP